MEDIRLVIRTDYLKNMSFKKIKAREDNEDTRFVNAAIELIEDIREDRPFLHKLDEY